MTNIALIGKQGVGKDTIAAHLVEHHGYTRVALADAVRQLALDVGLVPGLPEAVALHGWDEVKRRPHVRRALQNLGTKIRDLDPSFWLTIAEDKIARIDGPVVITDVRFRNEAEWLTYRGFVTARVTRVTGIRDNHVSETELDDYEADQVVDNNGTRRDLYDNLDKLLEQLTTRPTSADFLRATKGTQS